MVVVKPPILWHFCYGSLNRLRQVSISPGVFHYFTITTGVTAVSGTAEPREWDGIWDGTYNHRAQR